MKILMTGNTAFKLANFRKGLIRRMIEAGHQVVALVPEDEYVTALRDFGCDVIPLKMDRKGTSPISESRLLWSIYRVLRREQPDICFGYTIKNNIYGGLAARWLGLPFAPNVTGLGTAFEGNGLLNKLVKAMYRVAFKPVPRVFFQNENDRRLFLDASIVAPEVCTLLPGSGVDLQAFQPVPLPGSDRSPHFVLIARMLRDKGIYEFVEAAKDVARTHPEATFELVGPVDNGSRVSLTIDELEQIQRTSPVRYAGATTSIQPVIARSDVVVLPSFYREGTPRVLLEASAMARPIITTDTPGCRDTVDDGETGFLCAPRDAASLADAMRKSIDLGHAGREKFGSASRRKCESEFDEEIVISAYFSLLQHVKVEKTKPLLS